MRINAPEIGSRQHVSSLRGILLGHAKVEKYAGAEFAQRFDGKNLSLWADHMLVLIPSVQCTPCMVEKLTGSVGNSSCAK